MTPAAFVQARNYTPAQRGAIDLIVLHSAENSERHWAARNVAHWFQQPESRSSAHFVVDDTEVVQCVREEDVAWAAPGANHNGIHVEHCGRASQDDSGWRDSYSAAMLARSIELCADICRRWSIPVTLVTVTGLLSRNRGICTHDAVSRAFRRSTHTDPGRAFPLSWFVGRVAGLLA